MDRQRVRRQPDLQRLFAMQLSSLCPPQGIDIPEPREEMVPTRNYRGQLAIVGLRRQLVGARRGAGGATKASAERVPFRQSSCGDRNADCCSVSPHETPTGRHRTPHARRATGTRTRDGALSEVVGNSRRARDVPAALADPGPFRSRRRRSAGTSRATGTSRTRSAHAVPT